MAAHAVTFGKFESSEADVSYYKRRYKSELAFLDTVMEDRKANVMKEERPFQHRADVSVSGAYWRMLGVMSETEDEDDKEGMVEDKDGEKVKEEDEAKAMEE